jgi:hypothetical protein
LNARTKQMCIENPAARHKNQWGFDIHPRENRNLRNPVPAPHRDARDIMIVRNIANCWNATKTA